jgi:hypothetical protein
LGLPEARHAAAPSAVSGEPWMTSYNVLAAVLIICAAAGLGLGGLLICGAAIAHAVLGTLFVLSLMVSKR